MDNKYQQGKIYKITDSTNSKTYYGSTITPLNVRFSKHKSNYKRFKLGTYHNITVFSIFSEFGIENCFIQLVQLYACNSKNELEMKEGEYIKNNECVNRTVNGRTVKEWRNENEDKLKCYQLKSKDYQIAYQKMYRELHKNEREKINEYHRKRRQLKKQEKP